MKKRRRHPIRRIKSRVSHALRLYELKHHGIRPRLTVYEVERCYGGAEEGGWWYDAGTPVKNTTIRVWWFRVNGVRARMERDIKAGEDMTRNRYWFPAYDPTASDPDWGARWDDGRRVIIDGRDKPAAYPQTRPHYE
jgi:hypothetical protein